VYQETILIHSPRNSQRGWYTR